MVIFLYTSSSGILFVSESWIQDANAAEEAINKAFEIEIAQNKVEPCIVEKT
jgi:aspartokinase/homoserine dehydrogenase 1